MFGENIFKSAEIKTDCNFEYGTKGDLMAKSKDRGGTSLVRHSVEAAAATLTAATRIILDQKIREDVYRCSFIGALIHDLGKSAAGFQEMIKNPERPSWNGKRHEIISAAIFLHNFQKLKPYRKKPLRFFAIFLSIITHHKPYRVKGTNWPQPIPEPQWPPFAQFQLMWKETLCNKEALKNDWEKIIDQLEQDKWSSKLIVDQWLPCTLEIPEQIDCFRQFIEGKLEPFSNFGYEKGFINNGHLIGNDRFFLSLVRSLVTVGDHLASGNNHYVPKTPNLSQYRIVKGELRPFQSKIGNFGTAMLRAPTGSGKTEAAFNWLKQNQKNKEGLSRIFYVLPVQASINAMFKRWSEFLRLETGYRIVALHHSRAANVYFHLLEGDLTNTQEMTKRQKLKMVEKRLNEPPTLVESKDTWAFSTFIMDNPKWKRFFGKKADQVISYAASDMARLAQEIFFPIKVTTPHQMLKVLMQGQGWEPMVCDFTKCLVVFDEIHSYDSNLTGLILNLAKTLINQFDAKVLFMSATFPDLLKRLIHKHIGKKIPYLTPNPKNPVDRKFLERKRHKIKIHNLEIMDLIITLKEEIKNAESTLIICNTVSDAQQSYHIAKEQFQNKEVILLHSRFRYGDRMKKEKRIIDEPSNGKILVATQVVEVSLNIDYELGIIALAPLDALVQRLGRVNRQGKRPLEKVNVHICNPGKYGHLIYDKNLLEKSRTLLKSLDGMKLSESDLVNLINELYDDEYWKENGEKTFSNALQHNKIANFKEAIVPGSYRPWIDQILEQRERVTVDALLESDWEKFVRYTKRGSLKAADLLIPTYIKKENLVDTNKLKPRLRNAPPVLNSQKYKYSEEMGLTL